MTRTSIYRFLISLMIITSTFAPANSEALRFVSLSPALTELMYKIEAEDLLLGVSTTCNYPKEARKKEKIGNSFFVNREKIVKIHPDYVLACDATQSALGDFGKIGIKPLFFGLDSVEDIYLATIRLGKLTGKTKEAEEVVSDLKRNIAAIKPTKQKRILYLVQLHPIITVGRKSFISDTIKRSGQISVTDDLESYYPAVSEEYILLKKPDIIVVSFYSDTAKLKKLFPDIPIKFITPIQNDVINRPGPRIIEGIKFFADL